MSNGTGFSFAHGNFAKLLAVPKYALSWLLAFFVPRAADRWLFGSGIGVGEGALALARELRRQDPRARILWAVADEAETEQARAEGFEPVPRRGWAGYWATLRARHVVVTHGLGDANRFGVVGARICHLGHGVPLKRIHLDSPVTTAVRGPAPLRALLHRMYLAGTRRIELYVASSSTAAERLRSAYRVAPGRVRALGDPRDDGLAAQRTDPGKAAAARAELRALLCLPAEVGGAEPLILYAPTWRDGEDDPGMPSPAETAAIHALMQRLGARLVIRPHPLGVGAYRAALGERVHLLGSAPGTADAVEPATASIAEPVRAPEASDVVLREITPLLGAFDAVITDYSSIAVDFALLGRPIVWFAPDLERYSASRGLYEPLEITAVARVQRDWPAALDRLAAVLAEGTPQWRQARADARALAARFHDHPEGGAAERVLAEIRRLGLPARERLPEGLVFFESFYGSQASCNPLAIDREIAARFPGVPRCWSVANEGVAVPEGASPLLVGGPDWLAARRIARLLVVNDWLRYGFRRRRGQTVLQTWHGTMLKRLALDRPDVGLRTRLAIRRESRRWSLLISQNPHSTEHFRSSYAYRGEILETGYPRDDRLARSVVGDTRIPSTVESARRALGLPPGVRVLVYAPTWRDGALPGSGPAGTLDVHALAATLGDGWAVVARGHTRSRALGGYSGAAGPNTGLVIDASQHPDVNDAILAADLLVTDYSSLMFDAAVARVPLAFFVPDLVDYRDRERGFTFDFERDAPGPLLTEPAQLVEYALTDPPLSASYAAWCERFTPYDDGGSAARVVDALLRKGALPGSAGSRSDGGSATPD